jgi:hypothetical protein
MPQESLEQTEVVRILNTRLSRASR